MTMLTFEQLKNREEAIAVVGLGYVGLPLAVALGRHFKVIGVDVSQQRVDELNNRYDRTGEVDFTTVADDVDVVYSADREDLSRTKLIIVAVPTPIDEFRSPDLRPVIGASKSVGSQLQPGTVVVYESTVYPGLTEEICVPILEEESGLTCGQDFWVGYSPERINPGDKVHRLETITKVVAGMDEASGKLLQDIYGTIVEAGTHLAADIRTAEAAKVIENTQRDLNIALMNELAMIFDRMGIDTLDVLEAAGTKWNFLPFRPGLVGGHCIGVDPYYLTARAEEVGIRPEVILAGRRTNDGMGRFVAQKTVKAMRRAGVSSDRVGIVGLAFKENVRDVRNSRVFDVVRELLEFGLGPVVHDPLVDPGEARGQGIELRSLGAALECEAVVLAVPHDGLADKVAEAARRGTVKVLVDVKAAISRRDLPPSVHYWSL